MSVSGPPFGATVGFDVSVTPSDLCLNNVESEAQRIHNAYMLSYVRIDEKANFVETGWFAHPNNICAVVVCIFVLCIC